MRQTRLAAILTLLVLIPGCIRENRVTVRSVQESVVDAAALPVAVYATPDGNTADIYLTNLSQPQLDPGGSLEGASGRLIHLHLFLTPKAGSTPIATSACSVTVRHIVIADGEVGIYAGGGFLAPRTRVGAEEFISEVNGATLRLTGKTGGFQDALGPATFEATVAAQHSESQARRIGARVEELLRGAGAPER